MPPSIASLADLLAPVSEAEFFAEWHDKKPLHVPAKRPDKFAGIMSWEILTDCLNMTAIWSANCLGMVLDKERLPPERYCRQAIDRDGRTVWQPDTERVKRLLRQGASLAADDLDTLHPGMAAAADALERALGGKAQSNLYCSWAAHQAFDTHYDTHEVFAVHVEGKKVWRVYENRIDRPIAHPAFKLVPQEVHHREKGGILMEPTLRPGDLLYIPRGFYHDALAASESTLHITFGVTHVIGMDVLNLLLDHAVADPMFRSNFPLPQAGEAAMRRHLRALAARLGDIAAGEAMAEDLVRFRQDFHYHRGGFDLPADALDRRYAVRGTGLKMVAQGDRQMLKSAKGAAPVPQGDEAAVAWIIAHPEFSCREIDAAFPELGAEGRERLLGSLAAMKVIAPI